MEFINAPDSSTYSSQSINYHVFLSFRGKDTRNGFTDHLYSALQRKGIVTFRDDKDLKGGEVISEKLPEAIEQSLFSIVVLSQDYACSSWCLDELEKIIESRQNFGQTVLPIFYGVDPSNVRHQKRNFATAFEKHQSRFSDEKVRRWREALTKVADLSGWDTRNKHEAEIVEDIAKFIWTKLCDVLPSNYEHLVGDIQSKVDEIISLLKIGLDNKSFIGICGMGGIGKTTLARVVYDAIRRKFDASCFLANIRGDSERVDLVYLQKKLLSCLHIEELQINDIYDGVNAIRNFFRHKKVLIVLDDVSHRSQLDYLAQKKEWFGGGSKIIITTRDVQLLTQYEQFESYEVGMLDHDESLKLLCRKAFKKDKPEKDYLDLSKQVVGYACGLPLALEVLGSFLCTRNQIEWRETLEKLRQNLHQDIFNPLHMSYGGLEDEEYKEIFLDIACFLNRRAKFEVSNILKICGFHPIIGINVLIEKSLLRTSLQSNSRPNVKEHQDMYDRLQNLRRAVFLPTKFYDLLLRQAFKEYLYMHDLLQNMGRKIVLQESPSDAGKRSRLWSLEDIDLVLKRNKGTENVRSIVLERQQHFEANWHPNCFLKMKNLILLDLSKVHLCRYLNSLPSALKFLRWDYYALESLPSIDLLYELESLQLCWGKIRKLWDGTPSLDKLKMINLSHSKHIIWTPNFSATPNLEKLFLNHCYNLVRVDESVGQLNKLVELSFERCWNLVTLPSFLEMNNLEMFILGGCLNLEKLPEFGKNMRSLYFLDVRDTKITEIPSSIIHLIYLKYLDLSCCVRLESIPELPQNLIIRASNCPLLKTTAALRHLYASRASKDPIHLFFDFVIVHSPWKKGISRWFERREYRWSKSNSGEVVTITADVPCNVADYDQEDCWGIAISILFVQWMWRAWRGFSINWEFQDYSHPVNKSHGTQTIPRIVFDSRVYVGFFPINKENCRPHPSGLGNQLHLTLSFPTTNIISSDVKYRNLEIVECGWRLIYKKDFDALCEGGAQCDHLLLPDPLNYFAIHSRLIREKRKTGRTSAFVDRTETISTLSRKRSSDLSCRRLPSRSFKLLQM